jgi:hypothetical protein
VVHTQKGTEGEKKSNKAIVVKNHNFLKLTPPDFKAHKTTLKESP